MGLNIFLFVFSACLVYDTTNTTSKMTSSCSPTRINFQLYVRLAVIMGLTWITGLAAGFVDVEAVWYVFISLNTLQGLFIFVAFTCNRRVVNGVRESLRNSSLEQPQRHKISEAGGAARNLGDEAVAGLHTSQRPWKFSSTADSSMSSSTLSSTKKSQLDLTSAPVVSSSAAGSNMMPNETIPSRYGPRSKTMYTVSKQQVSGVTQNSFNGRYY